MYTTHVVLPPLCVAQEVTQSTTELLLAQELQQQPIQVLLALLLLLDIVQVVEFNTTVLELLFLLNAIHLPIPALQVSTTTQVVATTTCRGMLQELLQLALVPITQLQFNTIALRTRAHKEVHFLALNQTELAIQVAVIVLALQLRIIARVHKERL